jgi:poly-gamma-glutamate capsule biosynthesis protein CapA/YwtB (metallophosphatase superfamily)
MLKKIGLILLVVILSIYSMHAQSLHRLTCTFLGDIMAHDVNYRMKDYDLIYEDVKDLLLFDDLTFGNLEFPIAADLPYSTYPRFNVHPEYVAAAVKAGIDVFSLANNHACDQDREGVLKTLSAMKLLKQRFGDNIYFSGIQRNPDQEVRPETIYRNGIKIGFLAVTQFLNVPQDKPYVYLVDYNDEKQTEEFLNLVRRESPQYNLFIISFHGGVEYATQSDPKKAAFFKALIDAGADIVYGHHPHVLQPFEIIKKNGMNKLIIYSMGNFISGQTWHVNPQKPHNMWANTGDSMLLRVLIEIINGKAHIYRVNPIPISNYIKPNKDIVVKKLEPLAQQTLYGSWSRYYRVRLEVMKEFLRLNNKLPQKTYE